ncbi:MAG: HAD-IIIC family phosphatase [Novosphingobium sp.]|nr:HAD-IIIC family phosphatase [Novosphingobium sp.]
MKKILFLTNYTNLILTNALKSNLSKKKESIFIESFEFSNIEEIINFDFIKKNKYDLIIVHFEYKIDINRLYFQNKKDQNRFLKFYRDKLDNLFCFLNNNVKNKFVFFDFYKYLNKISINMDDVLIGKLNNYIYQLRKNYSKLLIGHYNEFISNYGRFNIYDDRTLNVFNFPFSFDYIEHICDFIFGFIDNILIRQIKLLVLDLDNTIYGGNIGDLGFENINIGNYDSGLAFKKFQIMIKKIQNKGIMISICSKNDYETAITCFENKNMILKKEDFSIIIANWDFKFKNIEYISEKFNLSLDSIMFIDDSKNEREEVKKFLPDVFVIEMPEDPCYYCLEIEKKLVFNDYFNDEYDKLRNDSYKKIAVRDSFKNGFLNSDEYFRQLKMKSDIDYYKDHNLNRIYQLVQRTNQFNFSNIRYSTENIEEFAKKEKNNIFCFTLKDIFEDYGIVGIVFSSIEEKQLYIDSFFISCRAFNKTLEHFIINFLIEFAKKNNNKTICFNYKKSLKNNKAKEFIEILKLNKINDCYILEDFNKFNTYIDFGRKNE